MSQVGSHGSMDVFVNKNPQDKFVTVENTGKSDAYVRTIIAYELGSVDNFNDVIMTSCFMTAQDVWKVTDIGAVEIDGNKYFVSEYIYNGAKALGGVHENGVLPAGDTTYPSLAQVYMKATATNEDCEAIDGNKNGTYDILVLSQAIQTEGFDNAKTALDTGFGESNAVNIARWFSGEEFEIPEVMTSYEDFVAANGVDGKYVIAEDMVAEDMIYSYGADVTWDLNGKTITAENKNQYALAAPPDSTLHLTGNGTVDMGKGFFASGDNAEIIIDGGTYNMTQSDTLNNVKHGSLVQNGGKVVINGGTFNTNVDNSVLFWATSNARIEINGGFFENTVDKTPDLLGVGTNKYNTNRIVITGGTFVNYDPLSDKMCYTGAWPAAGEAAFGGPWILIPGDYKVVSETQSNGDVWYSVVPK